ncbi:hypothetical protein C0J52_09355 [Blattella germanica]|nr:hypothetical protein C0J52_09355 [Blattella germanica]
MSLECSNVLFEIKDATKTAQTLASCIVNDILSGGQHTFHVNESLIFGDFEHKCSCEIFDDIQNEVPQKLAEVISSCLLMDVGAIDDDDTVRQKMMSIGEKMYDSCPKSEPEFPLQDLEKISLKEGFDNPKYRRHLYKIVMNNISELCKSDKLVSEDKRNDSTSINGNQYMFVIFNALQMYLLTKLLK